VRRHRLDDRRGPGLSAVRLSDDALPVLWSLYDASGIRPEWVLPMLHLESSFDPSAVNAKSGALGVAQDLPVYLTRNGVDVAAFRTMTAGEQIQASLAPRLTNLAKHYGGVQSATRVYQANYLPATLPTARALFSPLAWKPQGAYVDNALLDPQKKGVILVCDLAHAMAVQAASSEVADALKRAYALRPTLSSQNVVYGADFVDPLWSAGALLFGAGVGAHRLA